MDNFKEMEKYLYLEDVSRILKSNLKTVLENQDDNEIVYTLQMNNSLFNWITDPRQSPKDIVYLLDTCLRELDGFNTCKMFKALVSFICLEAVAKRRPAVLSGSWEQVAYIVVKYSWDSWDLFKMKGHVQPLTLKWILEYCSPTLCPNPCLRLELFRLFMVFGKSRNIVEDYDWRTLRNSLVSTMCEISTRYSSLTVNHVPKCSARYLYVIMENNHIDMKSIMERDHPKTRRIEILSATAKLAGMFALLEKDRHKRLNLDFIDFIGFQNASRNHYINLRACFSLFGLDNPNGSNGTLTNFMMATGESRLLCDVIDTFTKVYDASLCDNQYLCNSVYRKRTKVLDDFFIRYQHRREIYGGLSKSANCRLRNLAILPGGYYHDNINLIIFDECKDQLLLENSFLVNNGLIENN